MTTFALVHGMFHGAWCWSRVVPMLEGRGHSVITLTQTGVGERSGELRRDITLQTFVHDLVAVLDAEDLDQVVLVGHSFGGNAISGAAALRPKRIRHLIYLDGVVPQDGVAPLSMTDPPIAAERRAAAEATGGLCVNPPDPSVFGVPEGPDADWVRAAMTPHPFGTLITALELPNGPSNGRPATYVYCNQPSYSPLAWARDLAREQPGWAWRELAAGHDCMVTAPKLTADLLMEIAP